ncbi:phage uncharacterized protein [Rhodococcus rhodochrous ATCC 21198]|nr:phage terminase large subunit [Rhodococcus aetherivorans]ETT25249.1 phage uncharacterized protein [Rhodococcus rhodochrous ATCC 21198]MDV6295197.1 phage terminase large subunit [Rhodococcus aetherivorans]
MDGLDLVRREAQLELARRYFYDYCQTLYGEFYADERTYLRDVCDRLQAFMEQNERRFLVINMPPRHAKSFTAKNFTEWLFGRNNRLKVMTGSYNETLSTTFARQVRNTIEERSAGGRPVFRDIFPGTQVKYGEASASIWSLDGNNQKNYLATSPTGTATGFGANVILIDDIIKNAEEAYSALVLEKHWDWLCVHEDTLVDTPSGKRAIKTLKVDDKVLSYNLKSNKIEVGKVKRTHGSEKQCYKITLNDGREITATPEHRFYTDRGYLELKDILLELWRGQDGRPTGGTEGNPFEVQGHVLLDDVRQHGEQQSTSGQYEVQLEDLPDVWEVLPAAKGEKHLLLYGLQESGNESKNVRCEPLELQGRVEDASQSTRQLGRCQGPVEAAAPVLCEMPQDAEAACASSGSRPQQQRGVESNSPLRLLPYQISSVSRLPGDELSRVYDIEVEGNHNYFANGVLTHNCNTMMQRTEGHDWKVIIIMTRWSTDDLAGRVLASYEDVELITYKAVQDDGTMLCESILNRPDYDLKTKEMNRDIVEANYNQQPIDIKGRLFSDFTVYESLPEGQHKRWNYTDTADTGADFLCSVDYIEHEGNVYVTDVVMTDEAMETTESSVAAMLDADEINEATIESNNGGRGFARNIERILQDVHGNKRCVVKWVAQTGNKEARILASSAWVNKHVMMPYNWKHRYPEFYKQLMTYQKKGKNKHDDAPDVLAAIYERVANPDKKEPRLRVLGV